MTAKKKKKVWVGYAPNIIKPTYFYWGRDLFVREKLILHTNLFRKKLPLYQKKIRITVEELS